MRYSSRKKREAEESQKPGFPFSGSMILTMQGGRELVVENYQGILQFDEHLLALQAKKEQVHIYGNHLSILYYTKDELKVSGKIHKVEVVSGE